MRQFRQRLTFYLHTSNEIAFSKCNCSVLFYSRPSVYAVISESLNPALGLLDVDAVAEQDAHAGASMGVKAILPTLQRSTILSRFARHFLMWRRDCSNLICIRKSLNATKYVKSYFEEYRNPESL